MTTDMNKIMARLVWEFDSCWETGLDLYVKTSLRTN